MFEIAKTVLVFALTAFVLFAGFGFLFLILDNMIPVPTRESQVLTVLCLLARVFGLSALVLVVVAALCGCLGLLSM